MAGWIQTAHYRPPQGEEVLTRIVDQHGTRNRARMRLDGAVWVLVTLGVPVSYEPTHWRRGWEGSAAI